MDLNTTRELAALQRLSVKDLRGRYADVFGEPTHVNNRGWLIKRVPWRLQALAEGDLSERARRRAAELANDADLRLNPPKGPTAAQDAEERTKTKAVRFQADDRLPPPGSVITRKYKGDTLQVQVLPHGFAFEGQRYGSLSAVAKAITGAHCNGFLFFRLNDKGGNS